MNLINRSAAQAERGSVFSSVKKVEVRSLEAYFLSKWLILMRCMAILLFK
jgi:hypothetical protein